MTNILITGGSGYVGSSLAEHFAGMGDEITLLVRSLPKPLRRWSRRYRIVKGDLLKPRTLLEACRGMDTIIHCAALNEVVCQQHPELALLVNGQGTQHLLDAAVQSGVKTFVYLSTFHVYGHVQGNITEETVLNPLDEYSRTHVVGEHYVQEYHAAGKIKGIVLRVSNGYGAPVHQSIDRWTLALLQFCKQATETGTITLKYDGSNNRDFVALSDVAQAIQLLLKTSGHDVVFNVGGDFQLSIAALAQLVASCATQLTGKKVCVLLGKAHEPQQPFQYSVAKLTALGYVPRHLLEEEIIKTLQLLKPDHGST